MPLCRTADRKTSPVAAPATFRSRASPSPPHVRAACAGGPRGPGIMPGSASSTTAAACTLAADASTPSGGDGAGGGDGAAAGRAPCKCQCLRSGRAAGLSQLQRAAAGNMESKGPPPFRNPARRVRPGELRPPPTASLGMNRGIAARRSRSGRQACTRHRWARQHQVWLRAGCHKMQLQPQSEPGNQGTAPTPPRWNLMQSARHHSWQVLRSWPLPTLVPTLVPTQVLPQGVMQPYSASRSQGQQVGLANKW
mmetsp:Transcript_99828/g.258096  ORF Transcript_99828/g.258096 Transcript_99828/m.258096 type:complete len:252 (-) Transcript_99828:303-1058(-)